MPEPSGSSTDGFSSKDSTSEVQSPASTASQEQEEEEDEDEEPLAELSAAPPSFTTVVRGFSPAFIPLIRHASPSPPESVHSDDSIPEPHSSPAPRFVQPKKQPAKFALGESSPEDSVSERGHSLEQQPPKPSASASQQQEQQQQQQARRKAFPRRPVFGGGRVAEERPAPQLVAATRRVAAQEAGLVQRPGRDAHLPGRAARAGAGPARARGRTRGRR